MDAYMCFIHCPLFIDTTLYIDNKLIRKFFSLNLCILHKKTNTIHILYAKTKTNDIIGKSPFDKLKLREKKGRDLTQSYDKRCNESPRGVLIHSP